MAENEFLIDLNLHAAHMPAAQKAHSYFPNGQVASDAFLVTPAEGPHGLYWMLDTLMYKTPEGMDDAPDDISGFDGTMDNGMAPANPGKTGIGLDDLLTSNLPTGDEGDGPDLPDTEEDEDDASGFPDTGGAAG